MNTHEDNLRDLVLIYCEDCGVDRKTAEAMFGSENDDTKAEKWAQEKTEKAIKAIEYV